VNFAALTTGRRVVLLVSATAVVVAALFGYVLGFVIQPNVHGHVGTLGPFVFELTPANLAVYGAVMVGVPFVVVLFLVSYVSRHDDVTPVDVDSP